MKQYNIHTIWLFITIFAFFYELPLINISFDRLNPRLIDVVTLMGVALYGSKLGIRVNNIIYSKWKYIVYWFVFCSVVSSIMLLKGSHILFSLLAALRYLEGLLLIKLVLVSNINKRTVFWALLCGLFFDALYCIYQYGHPTVRELAPGVFVEVNIMTGPLSTSYFEIAQLLPTAVLFSMGLIGSVIKRSQRTIYYLFSIACAWPLLYTGSRTGLVLILVALSSWLILQGQKKIGVILMALLVIWNYVYKVDFNDTELETLSRAYSLEEGQHDDVSERIEVGTTFNIKDYDNAYVLPIIGAGFNVAPRNGHPRIDYGIHSMYLYPFEQAGIIGLVLFLSFLYTCMKFYLSKRKTNELAIAALSLLVAMMVTGTGAHNFWREFSSGNVNTLIVLFFCLTYKFSNEENKNIAHQ